MTKGNWRDRWKRSAMVLRAPVNFLRVQSYRHAIFQGMQSGEAWIRDGAPAKAAWRDRWERVAMVIRAPFNLFATPSYRKWMLHSMRRGETWIRLGVKKIRRPSPRSRGGFADYPLPLAFRRGDPAVCLFVSSIAFDVEPTDTRPVLALLTMLAAAGVRIRLVAAEESPGRHENRIRAWLTDKGVLAEDTQARLEIIDGAAGFTPIDPIDLVVAPPSYLPILSDRLAERGWRNSLHCLDEDGLFDHLRAAAAAWPSVVSDWPERSRWGLGYRVLKPLAPGHVPGRTCLFVHFDPGGCIDTYVLHYLAALKAAGFDVVLISSCRLIDEAFAAAEPLTIAALSRQNKGLDFSGWALALELFPALIGSQTLVIANDSVYGPIGPLQPLLNRMDAEPLDVWGAVESKDIAQHFQSWFVCFSRSALVSSAFAAFWSSVMPIDNKSELIRQYEVPVWRMFETAGLRVGAAVTTVADDEIVTNPTMDDWRAVLEDGAPFVKVQLLRDNPLETKLGGWAAELSNRGFPVSLVVDHLYRVKGGEAACFKTR